MIDCALYVLVIIICGYLVPIGFSFHGWSNKKFEIVEYYLKFIFFFIMFENFVSPSLGMIVYKLNHVLWCLLHIALYLLLISPKLNYLNKIYEHVNRVTHPKCVSTMCNNYVVGPLGEKLGKAIDKVKDL